MMYAVKLVSRCRSSPHLDAGVPRCGEFLDHHTRLRIEMTPPPHSSGDGVRHAQPYCSLTLAAIVYSSVRGVYFSPFRVAQVLS